MSSAANISPRRTRAKNADTHPGHAVLQTARRKRRTKDEIARDNQRIQEELEAKEAAALQGIQRLANIEAGMEQMKASVATRKPTAIRPSTRPRPVPVKKKSPVASQEEIYLAEDRASRVDDQDFEKLTMDLDIVGDNMCVDEEIKAARPKMQKTVKPSLKDAVHAARLKLMRGDNNHVTKAHVTDRKGKSLPAAS
ncbi:hypothetical protein M405DRAFT_848206, partial [Rhizopogon salebrosus TDB-379]